MTASELLHRIPEVFDAGGLERDAVVQYDIAEPVYHVLRGGTLSAVDGRADAPDVTIRVGDDDLIALMKGELEPMSAVLSGRVKLKGDVMLARQLVSQIDRERLTRLLP